MWEIIGAVPILTTKIKRMKEYKWGRIMTANQVGFKISWGESLIPKRKYVSIEIPFLIIQIYIKKIKPKNSN